MLTCVKTITGFKGKFFMALRSQRILLSDCEVELNLYEHSFDAPCLGNGRIIDKHIVKAKLTFKELFDNTKTSLFDKVSRFEIDCNVYETRGYARRLEFDNCQLDGVLDLTEAGSCEFDINCSNITIKELLAL